MDKWIGTVRVPMHVAPPQNLMMLVFFDESRERTVPWNKGPLKIGESLVRKTQTKFVWALNKFVRWVSDHEGSICTMTSSMMCSLPYHSI